MTDATVFVTLMAALSTAVQTFVDHGVKKRIRWLDTPTPDDPVNENRRQTTIHLLSFLVGAALAWSLELRPLSYLGGSEGLADNVLAAGLLVSFGGSFFNELLGLVREYKKAKRIVRTGRAGEGGPAPGIR